MLPTNDELKSVYDTNAQAYKMCYMCGTLKVDASNPLNEGAKFVNTQEMTLCSKCEEMARRFPDIFDWVRLVLGNHLRLMHNLP